MRLIDADELEDTYKNRLGLVMERYGVESSEAGILGGAIKLLKTQPTIASERKRGRWEDCGVNGWRCSNCRYEVARYNNTAFCPNCSADMREGGTDG